MKLEHLVIASLVPLWLATPNMAAANPQAKVRMFVAGPAVVYKCNGTADSTGSECQTIPVSAMLIPGPTGAFIGCVAVLPYSEMVLEKPNASSTTKTIDLKWKLLPQPFVLPANPSTPVLPPGTFTFIRSGIQLAQRAGSFAKIDDLFVGPPTGAGTDTVTLKVKSGVSETVAFDHLPAVRYTDGAKSMDCLGIDPIIIFGGD